MRTLRTVILASLQLNHPSAHATSFDCNKGRSVTEQLICHRADLSKLDDDLGKLYRQARRSVANPRALRADSEGQWAWREANCRAILGGACSPMHKRTRVPLKRACKPRLTARLLSHG